MAYSFNVDCLLFYNAEECQEDGRRRVNKVAWKTVLRLTVGEEAAAGFDDAFDGVE